jgi:hypothetical protein
MVQETARRRGCVSTNDALDWLCFHLEQSQLPVKFAAGAQSAPGDSVKVVVRADPDAVAFHRCPAAAVYVSLAKHPRLSAFNGRCQVCDDLI